MIVSVDDGRLGGNGQTAERGVQGVWDGEGVWKATTPQRVGWTEEKGGREKIRRTQKEAPTASKIKPPCKTQLSIFFHTHFIN